jgi:hypothetical protein
VSLWTAAPAAGRYSTLCFGDSWPRVVPTQMRAELLSATAETQPEPGKTCETQAEPAHSFTMAST